MVRGRQRLRALRLIPTPPTRPPAPHHHAAAAATTAATTTTTTALADAGVGWLAGDCVNDPQHDRQLSFARHGVKDRKEEAKRRRVLNPVRSCVSLSRLTCSVPMYFPPDPLADKRYYILYISPAR